MISLIVAFDQQMGIGLEGGLPWHLPNDLKRFKRLTLGNTVLMGRKTWDSLKKPLPGRKNLVVSRSTALIVPPEVGIVTDLVDYLERFQMQNPQSELFVIGGAEIYRACLPIAHRIYLTRLHGSFRADTFFPWQDGLFRKYYQAEFLDGDAVSYSYETWGK